MIDVMIHGPFHRVSALYVRNPALNHPTLSVSIAHETIEGSEIVTLFFDGQQPARAALSQMLRVVDMAVGSEGTIVEKRLNE